MRRLLLAAVLLGPLFHGCDGHDARFEQGAASFDAGDYAAALEVWRPLAESGHAAAQYQLGVMYREALGVTQDNEAALRWFRGAAEEDVGEAMLRLGEMHFRGQGTEPDVVEAYVWVARAERRKTPAAGQILLNLVRHMTAEEIAEAQARAGSER